jgi:ComF family protein
MGLSASFLDLVFAPRCLGCDGPIHPGDTARVVCRGCRLRLPAVPTPLCARCGAPRLLTGRDDGPGCPECVSWPPALRAARSVCMLAPPADQLVYRLKYRGWGILGEPLGRRLAQVVLPADVAAEARIVVPVPTTRKRMRQRGYNQAALIAEAFARATGRPLRPLLERQRADTSQTGLQPASRTANVAGTFRVPAGVERHVIDAHLLLVDDVLTTGATAAECARTLVAAGARCASVITFARAAQARRPDS